MERKSPKRSKEKRNERKPIKFRCDYSSTPLRVLQARGWRQVDDASWDLWWCDTGELRLALEGRSLRPQQRVAHFLSHCELTRKNYLYRNLKRYKRLLLRAGKNREAELCDAMPTSFELPSEYRMLVEEYRRAPGTTWIVKPASGSQRLRDLNEWRAKDCTAVATTGNNITPETENLSSQDTYVVQKYIDNPYLLDGRKFDLRIYVLVTSFQPLKVWLAREGFARLSSEQFSLERIDDSRIHLTNMSIQLRSNSKSSVINRQSRDDDPQEEKDGDDEPSLGIGRKWALNCLREYLTGRHGAQTVDDLFKSIAVVQADSLDDLENNSTKNDSQVQGHQPTEKPARTKNRKKTIRIGWLHRESTDKRYRPMEKPLGGVRRLKLDASSFYSADLIRQMAAEQFADSLEDRYDLQLGLFDGQVISEFELPNGEPCDIWNYCQAHHTTPYRLNLFILTSPKDEFHTDRQIDRPDEKLTRSRRRTKIRNGEYVPRDDVHVLYHYVRTSKYSGEMSSTECRKRDLHTYFLEEQFGDGPAVEQFDPLDYGYSISRIEKDDRILMRIGIESDASRSFHFPCGSEAQPDRHVVLHDVDELQGFCDGSFGLGFIPSCTCRGSRFTWFRDGQLLRSGESLYWMGNLVLEPGRESSTFCCVVECKTAQTEIKSKEIQVTEDMIGKRLEYPY